MFQITLTLSTAMIYHTHILRRWSPQCFVLLFIF